MSRVIAAADVVNGSRSVLGMARAVAEALDASLEILNLGKEGDRESREAEVGTQVHMLTSAAGEEDVVAIVIGSGSTHDVRGALGHLAMAVAGRIDKPVVMVPPDFIPPERLNTAVVAMKGTPAKARVLQRSIALSARAGLEIVVVHVENEDSVPSFSDQFQYETEAYAQEFFARHLIGAPRMRLELRIGVPVTEVLRAVESASAELLAVGWSNDPGRGAVARGLAHRSPVPVLLVPVV